MENLLREKGMWHLIKKNVEEHAVTDRLSETQIEELKNKDCKVKYLLFLAIDKVTFQQILDRNSAKIVWESLKIKFGGNERVKRSLLNTIRCKFEILKMKKSETIKEYFARITAITNQMRSNGETMSDTIIVEKILRTLTKKFIYVVFAIEEVRNVRTMSVDELQSLVVHEQKFKPIENEEYQALKIYVSINGRGRDRDKEMNRERVGRGRAFDKSQDEEEVLLMTNVESEVTIAAPPKVYTWIPSSITLLKMGNGMKIDILRKEKSNEQMIDVFKEAMMQDFEMTDLG
ncbi:uncharacterized protein LOC124909875 [Impatiens glandulifera]|uniref:uncharacterized protein LOC124909875 n=1 Tax=Impatiens glandulifera TaxID=253017 RepID=UPI001FB15F98|nr:uncharacterized protein LOC124909875 [Impatiens glandulifera]